MPYRDASDAHFSVARIDLLDWTGHQLSRDKVGVIPEHLAPILSRLGSNTLAWCDVVQKFGRMLERAAGTPESLTREAIRSGQLWLCVLARIRSAYRRCSRSSDPTDYCNIFVACCAGATK